MSSYNYEQIRSLQATHENFLPQRSHRFTIYETFKRTLT